MTIGALDTLLEQLELAFSDRGDWVRVKEIRDLRGRVAALVADLERAGLSVELTIGFDIHVPTE